VKAQAFSETFRTKRLQQFKALSEEEQDQAVVTEQEKKRQYAYTYKTRLADRLDAMPEPERNKVIAAKQIRIEELKTKTIKKNKIIHKV